MAILSQIGLVLRGTAKGAIKGGIILTNTVSGFAAAAGKELNGLLSEARTEVNSIYAARSTQSKIESEGLRGRLVRMGDAVRETGSKMASTVNAELAAVIALCTGESKEKAEKKVEKGEEFVERLGRELTEEESGHVIETVLVATP